jgi:hypothetical protein
MRHHALTTAHLLRHLHVFTMLTVSFPRSLSNSRLQSGQRRSNPRATLFTPTSIQRSALNKQNMFLGVRVMHMYLPVVLLNAVAQASGEGKTEHSMIVARS